VLRLSWSAVSNEQGRKEGISKWKTRKIETKFIFFLFFNKSNQTSTTYFSIWFDWSTNSLFINENELQTVISQPPTISIRLDIQKIKAKTFFFAISLEWKNFDFIIANWRVIFLININSCCNYFGSSHVPF
jgi:hypothetical protein